MGGGVSNFASCDEVASQCSLYPEPYSCHVTLRSRIKQSIGIVLGN